MRFPPVSDIKKRRKALDMTQADLSHASGVSQSTIAKIEGGRMSPSYETAVRLFEALDAAQGGERTLTAADVASHDVVWVKSTDLVHMASDLMRRTGYSQLPVIDGGVPVGSISERMIFELLRGGATMGDLAGTTIEKIMAEPFPVVSDSTPMATVTGLMEGNNAVLVSHKGAIVGMITNADILKLI